MTNQFHKRKENYTRKSDIRFIAMALQSSVLSEVLNSNHYIIKDTSQITSTFSFMLTDKIENFLSEMLIEKKNDNFFAEYNREDAIEFFAEMIEDTLEFRNEEDDCNFFFSKQSYEILNLSNEEVNKTNYLKNRMNRMYDKNCNGLEDVVLEAITQFYGSFLDALSIALLDETIKIKEDMNIMWFVENENNTIIDPNYTNVFDLPLTEFKIKPDFIKKVKETGTELDIEVEEKDIEVKGVKFKAIVV